jgi:hypothetical protein
MTTSLLRLTRAARAAQVAAFAWLASGCSSDSGLFDDTSFAGVNSGGKAATSPNATGGTGGEATSGGSSASGTGGNATTGGDSNDMPPSDGGAAGAPSPSPCVVTGIESCNAKDDDCNGVVDDGCPGGVTTTFEKDLQLLGDSAGGAAFTDDCQDGELLAGVELTMGAFLSQIRGVCRTISLELSQNAEHGYQVTLGTDHALSAHPATSVDTPTTLSCGAHEAVVGVRLAEQYYGLADSKSVPVISRVWLTCAKLVLTDVAGKLSVTWSGAKELAPASGSIANGTAWLVSANAPEGLVASRLLGASGSWIDRVGFGVSRVGVVMR